MSIAPVPSTPLNFFMLTSKYGVPSPNDESNQGVIETPFGKGTMIGWQAFLVLGLKTACSI
ncbi:hypothetical protein [Pusillimonas caeni]|uniref:hypothetical protein n=1 Tax=Pusillimonas caeni TaxID=1348472 RepID=UPI001431B16C|nr:hypothetical protein [Pusillimonas caeni]